MHRKAHSSLIRNHWDVFFMRLIHMGGQTYRDPIRVKTASLTKKRQEKQAKKPQLPALPDACVVSAVPDSGNTGMRVFDIAFLGGKHRGSRCTAPITTKAGGAFDFSKKFEEKPGGCCKATILRRKSPRTTAKWTWKNADQQATGDGPSASSLWGSNQILGSKCVRVGHKEKEHSEYSRSIVKTNGETRGSEQTGVECVEYNSIATQFHGGGLVTMRQI
ncbi:hypothetical protein BU17DRAFT_65468 [Hysterangium stoloniferum]|nr:hypothetical protein BU17DRAFT_65468 [Hysterangium stoloniferum]